MVLITETLTYVFKPLHSKRSDDPRLIADEDLMARVYDGDVGAFEVIFDRHSVAAFSLAYRMCGRRAMAEDVVQEAFLSLWRSGARYDRARKRPFVGPERRPQPSRRRLPTREQPRWTRRPR